MKREALPARGSHAGGIFGVQLSNQKWAEMNRPTRWSESFESERLTDESTSDKAQTTIPFDVAMRTDASLDPIFGIAQDGPSLRRRPARSAIMSGRRFLSEGFVRATMIVVVAPAIGPALLGAAIGGGRIEHFGLVAAVQLLVRGVVARACPACELDANPQAQPPDAQARKPQGSLAAKGRTVVHPDRGGQTVAAEDPGKDTAHVGIALRWEQPDLEQVTTFGFAHRERLLALAVGRAKPTLEIDRPDLMASPGRGQPWMGHEGAATGAARRDTHQTQLAQPTGDRAHRREPCVAVQLAQAGANFSRTPIGTGAAHLFDQALPKRRLLPRTAVRPTRPILERRGPTSTITPQPFVTSPAAHAVFGTDARKRLLRTQDGQRKTLPLQNQ